MDVGFFSMKKNIKIAHKKKPRAAFKWLRNENYLTHLKDIVKLKFLMSFRMMFIKWIVYNARSCACAKNEGERRTTGSCEGLPYYPLRPSIVRRHFFSLFL